MLNDKNAREIFKLKIRTKSCAKKYYNSHDWMNFKTEANFGATDFLKF